MHRVVMALASILIVVGCTSDANSSGRGEETDTSSDPTTASAHEAFEAPASVTCKNGEEPSYVTFDSAGHRSFTALLTSWADDLGPPAVNRDEERIYFLREDGTAHSALRWSHSVGVDPGWFEDSVEQCSDHEQWNSVTAPTTRVALVRGHCWIEPVTAHGIEWDVVADDQSGWGDGDLSRFSGSGTLQHAGDVAIYVDDEGRRLSLVPSGDPWALQRFPCG